MMRPDDLHLAMRSDLVLILKDVVGLIARIEASIPNTPEESRERTSRTTGECPEASTVDETPSAVGAGAAGPQQTAATIPDQPTDAALPPSVVPAVPPAAPSASQPQPALQEDTAPERTKTDQALDLWATTNYSEQTIAALVGCAVGSVKGFVYAARKKNDPRAFARKLAHDDKLSEQPAPKPTLIKRGDDEPPVSGFAQPVERKPFDRPKSSPYDPRPGRLAGVTITSPGSVVSLDMGNFVVACPGGDWQTSRPVALIMERMRNGETFASDVLADLGSMGAESFSESRKRWAEQLAPLGITFVHTKHVGCRIEVAK